MYSVPYYDLNNRCKDSLSEFLNCYDMTPCTMNTVAWRCRDQQARVVYAFPPCLLSLKSRLIHQQCVLLWMPLFTMHTATARVLRVRAPPFTRSIQAFTNGQAICPQILHSLPLGTGKCQRLGSWSGSSVLPKSGTLASFIFVFHLCK